VAPIGATIVAVAPPARPPAASLPAFPAQPDGVPWPTLEWPVADPDESAVDVARLDQLFAEAFSDAGARDMGQTLAAVCVHRGAIVAEQYAEGVAPSGTLPSWSMAKSIAATVTGILVGDGRLAVDDPVRWPGWAGDERATITVDHLLQMRPSLAWLEEYTVDGD
jgi:CubicO group peptidase (beta-lactamase class C family)